MIGNWGEVVTRYPYRKVRMDHLLSKELIRWQHRDTARVKPRSLSAI